MTTGYEMAQLAVPDKLAMLSYLTQVHELFRGEIPCVKQPKRVSFFPQKILCFIMLLTTAFPLGRS